MNRWWDENADRLNREIQLMNQKFPQFQLGETIDRRIYHEWTIAGKGQLFWKGDLRTNSGNTYKAVITYPDHYPGMEIRTFIIEPYLTRPYHRYGDGHLCLYSNDHGGRGQGTGTGMTAVSYVGWTAAWLHAYEIYLKNGTWPENSFFDRAR